jgi:transcriptional regulator with XRE-family HTH domain
MLNQERETASIDTRLDRLAKNLTRRMEASGMTEFALANASGISARTVGNFLRPGNRKSKQGTSRSFPSGTIANLFKIATALDVEAWELLCSHDPHDRFHQVVEAAFIERMKAMLTTP